MLGSMRTIGDSKAAKGFFLLLAAAFVLWGVGDYLIHTVGGAAVTVNGEDISAAEVQQTYNLRRQNVEQVLGKAATPEQLAELRLGDRVLQEVISRAVLRQQARALGLVASPAQLRAQIGAIPEFRGPDGHFDLKRYEQAVKQTGMSTKQFESEMGRDLSVQLLTSLVQLAPVSGEAIRPLVTLEGATLTLETLTLKPETLRDMPAPTAAQVEVFYKENPALYTLPEKRSYELLTLSPAAIAATISVPEGAARKQYDAHKNDYLQPESRKVAHILVADEAKAKALRAQLQAGGDDAALFAKLARENSEDPGSKAGGGELGEIHQAEVVPEFGKEAFSLPVGAISAPVKSSFGWHIIRVAEITPAKMPTFEEIKPQIEASLKQDEAETVFGDLSKKVDAAISAGTPLTKVASDNGLKLERQSQVPASTNALDTDVLQAVFAAKQGEITPPLQGVDGSVKYIQVSQITPLTVQPLAQVQAQATADATKAQRTQALMAAAQQVLNSARAPAGPATLAAAAQSLNVPGESGTLTLGALDTVPEWLHPSLVNIVQLPEGATLAQPIRNGNDVVLVKLTKRTPGTPDAAALSAAAGGYHQRIQQDVEGQLIQDLIKRAKVDYNLTVLRQVFGADFTPKAPGAAE